MNKYYKKNPDAYKNASLKYLKAHRELGKKLTNQWRGNLRDGQKITGYSDLTLISFKKDKLIEIIRKLESEVEKLKKYEPKENVISVFLKKLTKAGKK